ncbi:MAG: UDP-N-acetylmuramoyl-tripeptide--D-alanyl-D-alanine ligase [Salibacteraceae bacterium]|nr:UDP-N-acetylmuramoyl-tripeptide--D-alanyl-D-alanine ligase [Salibacteraceae bacterium]|tara:strand:+ start:55444 stop:56721 length:1278 start_codon:yes stop_codon:yes gene_type:complete
MISIIEAYKECGNSVCTDTRKITANCLFIALKGANFNGNQFTRNALELGAKYAVIDDINYQVEGKTILVKDGLSTLQQLASDYRKEFDIPVLGITGSNGKTTAKELIHAVISKKLSCHSTPGNFNNHIGLPLTLLSMVKGTEFCILEMGDNHMGEIATLSQIGKPTHALVTNVGKDHIEGFGSFENNKLAKKELFDYISNNNGIAFIPDFETEVKELAIGVENQISFGSDSSKHNISFSGAAPFVRYKNDLDEEFTTNLIGEYNIFNIQMAYAIGKEFGVSENEIHGAICSYKPSNLRSVFIEQNSNAIFLDAYNSNPSSLSAALESFEKQYLKPSRTAIIGDMLELGEESLNEHQAIVNSLIKTDLQVYLVGSEFEKTKHGPSIHWFPTRAELIEHISQNPIENTQILLKGSRGLRLEEVLEAL